MAGDTLAGGNGLVLVAEQVRELGGTERVVQALLDRYPHARLVAADFTTTNLPAGHPNPLLERAQLVPVGRRRRHFLSPLYARRFARAELGDADVVLSFVHMGWSAAVRVPSHARRVVYAAGLPKALYGHTELYLHDYAPPLRALALASLPLQRAQNRTLLRRADRVLVNSRCSQRALRAVHGVESETVYPPVRTGFFTPAPAVRRRHFLLVARLVRHKRADVVVRAFAGLRERLVVVGGGSELDRLRATAPSNVRFAGFVCDEELRALYRESHALVCPSVEEFGIVMAEAHACGVPVIAPCAGGALEIVRHGETGVLLPELTPATVAAAVRELPRAGLDPATCRAAVLPLDEARFLERVARVLHEERLRATAPAPAAPPRARAAAPAVAAAVSPGSPPPARAPAPARLSTAARP